MLFAVFYSPAVSPPTPSGDRKNKGESDLKSAGMSEKVLGLRCYVMLIILAIISVPLFYVSYFFPYNFFFSLYEFLISMLNLEFSFFC